jgi:FkbM family methyltransferase
MDPVLRLKAALVGSPLEPIAVAARRLLDVPKRLRHPELRDLHNEERLLPAVLSKLLKRNSNTVDVGCHIGSVLSAICKIAPDGSHVAIEPTPAKADWLKRRFPKVTVHQVAVGDIEGSAVFEEDRVNPGYSKLQGNAPASGDIARYTVTIRRLDDIVSGHIDLMKIDTEGHEPQVLRGTTRLIEASRPAIIFESASEYEPAAPERRKETFDLLTSLGYQIHAFADFVFDRGPMQYDEFRRCGLYPFRAFNYVALPHTT